MLILVIAGVVSVLFVSVSVVARPISVSVPIGKVSVPLLLMLAIVGVVSVLFVRVCVALTPTNCWLIAARSYVAFTMSPVPPPPLE